MTELLHITHASLVFLLIALMVILLVTSSLYIRHDHYLKIKQKKPQWMANIPSLEAMNRYVLSLFYLSFVVLTLVILNGLALAHSRWDQNWLLQPKFVLAQSTWLFFLIMLIVRRWKGLRGIRFLVWLLMGCIMVLFSMIGAYVW